MNEVLSVSACKYKLVQDPETFELSFFVCNVLTKTESADKRYTWQELYPIMCTYAHEYQREHEEESDE